MAKKSRRGTSVTQPIATQPVAPSNALIPWLERNGAKHALMVIAAATLAMLIPFIGKAFQIDDPLFIWSAQHIVKSPADFYGFDVNWYGSSARMYDVMQNPPLTSYYLAVAGTLLGWGEIALHFAFLIPALAAVVGVWQVARRVVDSPVLAALLTLVCPVFLVSATNVMSDVPMFACYVWAIAFWMRGLDEKRDSLLWLAAALTAASGLFKYFGLSLIPLLLVYGLVKRRSVGTWIVPLLLPIAVFAGYDAITASMYGKGHLTGAMTYAGGEKTPHPGSNAATTLLLTLAFTGGCAVSSLLFAPLLTARRWWIALVTLVIAAAAVFVTGAAGVYGLTGASGTQTFYLVQFVLFAAAGIGVFILTTSEAWRRRDAESILMLLWIGGTFVFADYFNWTVAARSLLPLSAPVAILIVSRLETVRPRRIALSIPLAIAAVVTLLVSAADYRFAGASREAAREIGLRYSGDGHRIWFEGHWGFQYYMQLFNGSPADLKQTVHRKDLWIVPSNNTKPFDNKPPNFELETVRIASGLPVSTMQGDSSAGFYSDFKGPLPYSFGRVPPEEFRVLRLGRRETP